VILKSNPSPHPPFPLIPSSTRPTTTYFTPHIYDNSYNTE
jgi:hypothetical protein